MYTKRCPKVCIVTVMKNLVTFVFGKTLRVYYSLYYRALYQICIVLCLTICMLPSHTKLLRLKCSGRQISVCYRFSYIGLILLREIKLCRMLLVTGVTKCGFSCIRKTRTFMSPHPNTDVSCVGNSYIITALPFHM